MYKQLHASRLCSAPDKVILHMIRWSFRWSSFWSYSWSVLTLIWSSNILNNNDLITYNIINPCQYGVWCQWHFKSLFVQYQTQYTQTTCSTQINLSNTRTTQSLEIFVEIYHYNTISKKNHLKFTSRNTISWKQLIYVSPLTRHAQWPMTLMLTKSDCCLSKMPLFSPRIYCSFTDFVRPSYSGTAFLCLRFFLLKCILGNWKNYLQTYGSPIFARRVELLKIISTHVCRVLWGCFRH